ncbi:SGNH hydrolase superfamily protein [Pleurotus pulmonarius]
MGTLSNFLSNTRSQDLKDRIRDKQSKQFVHIGTRGGHYKIPSSSATRTANPMKAQLGSMSLNDDYEAIPSSNSLASLKGDATYVTFLGINDCGAMGSEDLESIVESIFDVLRRLYLKCQARNFVLFDVPPTDRSPQAVDSDLSAVLEDNITTWNDALRDQAAEFGSSNKDVTVFVFSAHQVLTDVLDDPLEYDFSEDDPVIEGGHIWEDGLHLTSDMHDILCKQLLTSILADQL